MPAGFRLRAFRLFAADEILLDPQLPVLAQLLAAADGGDGAVQNREVQQRSQTIGPVGDGAALGDAEAVVTASMLAPRNRNSQPYCFF